MRDIFVTAVILGLLPLALFRPFIGVALWTWVSVMNPHRLTWGFAYDFPFAQIVAIVTLISLVIAWKDWKFPVTLTTVALIAFFSWTTFTLFFAFHYDESFEAWTRFAKTVLMTLVALAVVRSERQIVALAWILVLSVVFFGVKGGIFVLATGGEFRVYGPSESHIGDNNAISVALVMVMPLLIYLMQHARNKVIRFGGAASIVLSAISVLGSYSRGAFVAIWAMLLFLVLKARRRLFMIVLLVTTGAVALYGMPEQWADRMQSMANYERDPSIQSRFNAWGMVWNLARDRPIVGGGFVLDEPDVFARYAPNPEDVHVAHSIYFQMLGQHGFVGLGLYLLLGILMWRTGSRVITRSQRDPATLWYGDLARALQVSLIGFAVGGLTVNIGYWDVIYFELVILVALERLLRDRDQRAPLPRAIKEREAVQAEGAAATSPAVESGRR